MKFFYYRTPHPGNMGDLLSRWLAEKISGRSVRFSDPGPGVTVAVGSVLRFTQDGMHVWGTGAIARNDRAAPKAVYHAVRGPLTRDIVLRNGGDCPPVYGDPALLMPRYYSPTSEKKYRLGVIPHYVDFAAMTRAYPQLRTINVLNADPTRVIDQILECESIVSSSLHGLIIAQSYGIPAALIGTIEGRLHGDGTKFRDYFLSTGQEPYTPLKPNHLGCLPRQARLQFDDEKFLAACPFGKGM